MDYPLSPVSSPFSFFTDAGITLSSHQVAGALLLIVLIAWAINTLVAVYHWLRYSHAALIATPAIAIHLVVSGILIVFAGAGLLEP